MAMHLLPDELAAIKNGEVKAKIFKYENPNFLAGVPHFIQRSNLGTDMRQTKPLEAVAYCEVCTHCSS